MVLRRLIPLFFLLTMLWGHALSVVPRDEQTLARSSDLVLRARFLSAQCLEIDQEVFTRYLFERIESYLGEVPATFEIVSPGGTLGGLVHQYSGSPTFLQEEVYELYLKEWESKKGQKWLRLVGDSSGSLLIKEANPHRVAIHSLRQACASLHHGKRIDTYQSALSQDAMGTGLSAGLLVTDDTGAVVGARRFVTSDRQEPILVVVDDSTIPSGLSSSQVRAGIQAAIEAWEGQSSVKMQIVSYETFSKAANLYSIEEGSFIRIQCHDNFGTIGAVSGGRTVGMGGSRFLKTIFTGDGQTLDAIGKGGSIAGLPFYKSINGYVIIDHTDPFNSNPIQFTRVMTHEIGHVLGLAHSSEDPNESDPTLREAVMYYASTGGGGGATLNSYDAASIQKVHPLQRPPSGFDRILSAVSKPGTSSLANPQVNEVTLLATTLDSSNLTPVLKSSTTLNGQFSLVAGSSTLRYTPNYVIATALSESQILDGFYFDSAELAFQDPFGNESASFQVRVVSIEEDRFPAGAVDGIPDRWMIQYFGSASGSSAAADPDGDLLSNLEEYLNRTDPTDPKAPVVTITNFDSTGLLRWNAKLYGVYRLESTDDLGATNWGGLHLFNEGGAGEASSRALGSSALPSAPRAVFYRLFEQR